MNKLVRIAIAVVGVLVVAATLAVVGYRQGWFGRFGLRAPGPSGGAGGPSAGAQAPSAAGGGAGGPSAGQPASPAAGGATTTPAGQPAAPQFDGNVAALEWGGKVESATGVAADDQAGQERLLNLIDEDEDTYWASTDDPGPKEIVLSFAGHDLVRINEVRTSTYGAQLPRDVEVWVSSSSPSEGFTRVAGVSLPEQGKSSIAFDAVEARYVKLRLLHNIGGGGGFTLYEIKVMEAPGSGYTPLLARHPELLGPQSAQAGAAVAAAGAPPACVPVSPVTLTAGHGESKRVLAVSSIGEGTFRGADMKADMKKDPEYFQKHPGPDQQVVAGMDFTVHLSSHVGLWMLNPQFGYDTVVLEQVCPKKPEPAVTDFLQALPAWVAQGNKLIIHDADSCSPGPDYAWLPFHMKTDNPGGVAAPGKFLRFTEDNWMAHGHPGRPGFIDTAAWEEGSENYRNELGDTNTYTEWDPHWCGHMVVRNINNVFGFAHTYAHLGRGLIIYSGFDKDMMGSTGYDLLVARELAQGFDPDNLPCTARIGDFVVTTDPRLIERPLLPGRSYDYPLSLLSNQGYKGTVNLSVQANPGLQGMQASFAPASVALDGLAESKFSLTLPANAPTTPQALEVKGIDAGGKRNSLCLQLVQPTAAPPPTTAEALKAEIDLHGRAIIYINFDFNKAIIKPESKPIINEVIRMMKQSPDLKLSINGHTDNVGTHEYNIKLSQARAAAVVEALTKAGIAADRLSSAGFGDSSPIADNDKPEGRAKNRRVELVRM